ncbi:MAG: hypothetical protein RIQ81_1939 [Pseudomonadota bacterium]|jgi:hypothetical protein
MKFKQIMIATGFLLAPIAGMMVHSWWTNRSASSSSQNTASGELTTIDWPTLARYDMNSKSAPESLQKLDGRIVRLPGFMVPLEDNMQAVREFLLVPDPQACIHMPPPPPNQQVLVKMTGDAEAKVEWKPVWIEGHLRITRGTTKYGEAIFQVNARRTEAYKAGF